MATTYTTDARNINTPNIERRSGLYWGIALAVLVIAGIVWAVMRNGAPAPGMNSGTGTTTPSSQGYTAPATSSVPAASGVTPDVGNGAAMPDAPASSAPSDATGTR